MRRQQVRPTLQSHVPNMRLQQVRPATLQPQHRTFPVDHNANGYRLSDRPVNMQAQVENSRRVLQRKYEQEAAEAERKRKEKEKKKQEERLRRMEAFVKPGHVLGSSNLRRDLVEHQEVVAGTGPGPNWMEHHYETLVQGRQQRAGEIDQSQYEGPHVPQQGANPDRHNYQEQMRAAREQMQAKYNEGLRRTREQGTADVENFSLH